MSGTILRYLAKVGLEPLIPRTEGAIAERYSPLRLLLEHPRSVNWNYICCASTPENSSRSTA
jgi:hypothetical protein